MCGLVMFKKSEAASTIGSTAFSSFKIVKLRMASIWDISTMGWPLSQLVLSKIVLFACLPPGGVLDFYEFHIRRPLDNLIDRLN